MGIDPPASSPQPLAETLTESRSVGELRRAQWQGRALVVVAAVMWSTSGFFAKAPIFESWPIESRGLLLAFWRALFAALILATMVRRIQWSWRLVPMVILFAVMNWTFLTSLVLCESSLAIWLQYTAPAWVFLVAWKVFGEPPVGKDWWLLGFVLLGLAVIFAVEMAGSSIVGVAYGLASGFCFAGVVMLLRWNKGYDAAWLVFLNHAFTALMFLPVLVSTGIYPTGAQVAYLVGFGMIQLGIPYLLLARALNSISSHEASGLTLLEPILVPVWVWLAWSQSPGYQVPQVTTMIGGALILVGLAIRFVPFGRRL